MRRSFTVVLVACALTACALACGRRTPAFLDPNDLANHVTIRRDTFGIPHILADSEEAAAFGYGFAQAEDHAAEIGRRYLSARGEEARYFGERGLSNDLAMAQFDNLAEAQRGLERITPLYRRIITAYALGVNRFVGANRASLPTWMPEITAADVLASTRSSAADSMASQTLVRRLQDKYERGGSATEADLEWTDMPGSNALALAGSRTASGKPILLGNPHLQWASLYWEAHVRVPGVIDFYGSSLPGIPVLRAGFNDRLGFVTTNNAPDLDDIFALQMDPRKPDHYLFEGIARPLERRERTVKVLNADGSLRDETRTFWSSHLGVVIHRTAERAFAVRSSRLDALQYFQGFYELSKARTLKAWREALRRNYVPTSNFTYADADGNILYYWNGRVPQRPEGGDYRLDSPATRISEVWQRVHDIADYPFLLNPPGGYIQNANNPPRFVSRRDPIDMTRYPSYFERGNLALRPQLALEMLEAQPTFTADDVMRLKYSTRLLLAERVKGDVIAAVKEDSAASEEAHAGASVLDTWDNTVSAESRGAVLFQRFWELYSNAARAPYAQPWSDTEPFTTPRGISDRAAAVRSLAAAVRAVREHYGSETIAWGDVHRFRAAGLDLPGSGASGTYGAYRVMTFEPVGPDTPLRAAGHLPGRTSPAGFGDAWVLLVDFSGSVTARSVLAYGQTTNQESPHSSDQLRIFAAHQLRPVWYTEPEIKANLGRAYRP